MEIKLSESRPEKANLPVYESVNIGTGEANGEVFHIALGLDKKHVTELKRLSLDLTDTALQENTSDYQRFGEGSYEEWYAQSRVPFALIHEKTGALAALVWFGPKAVGQKSVKHALENTPTNTEVGDWHTIAFRSYSPFRGGGIMKDFVRTTTDIYLAYFPAAKLWTSNSRANIPSVKLSEKLGYQIDESLSDPETVTMIRQ